jgi:hypothetical protein
MSSILTLLAAAGAAMAAAGPITALRVEPLSCDQIRARVGRLRPDPLVATPLSGVVTSVTCSDGGAFVAAAAAAPAALTATPAQLPRPLCPDCQAVGNDLQGWVTLSDPFAHQAEAALAVVAPMMAMAMAPDIDDFTVLDPGSIADVRVTFVQRGPGIPTVRQTIALHAPYLAALLAAQTAPLHLLVYVHPQADDLTLEWELVPVAGASTEVIDVVATGAGP